MHDELADELSRATLAREVWFSQHPFMRLLREVFGATPGRYRTDLRIAHAYGVEALCQDDSGNWFSLTERR